mmetsp:Transcript_85206/g.268671  ORF Transcript_85206/g.268671 Transcript_85206/m.268671 type:complete len:223 (-) Transcript_85206:386-1054(-)
MGRGPHLQRGKERTVWEAARRRAALVRAGHDLGDADVREQVHGRVCADIGAFRQAEEVVAAYAVRAEEALGSRKSALQGLLRHAHGRLVAKGVRSDEAAEGDLAAFHEHAGLAVVAVPDAGDLLPLHRIRHDLPHVLAAGPGHVGHALERGTARRVPQTLPGLRRTRPEGGADAVGGIPDVRARPERRHLLLALAADAVCDVQGRRVAGEHLEGDVVLTEKW